MAANPARAPAAKPAVGRLAKYSVSVSGHRTSIALEPQFWARLRWLAQARGLSVPRLIAEIDSARGGASNLASAIRVHLLEEAVGAKGG
jgi:predicted DNA-binding ribbon-helix-helix protein